MNLIGEIVSAAIKSRNAYSSASAGTRNETAEYLITSDWWPRIRAALEAAQEMDQHIDWLGFRPSDTMLEKNAEGLNAQSKFRAAMEGATDIPQPQPPTAPDTPA